MANQLPQKKSFKALQLIHWAIFGGQTLFAIVCLIIFYVNSSSGNFKNIDQVLQVVAIVLSFAGFWLGSIFLFNKSVEKIRLMPDDVAIRFVEFRKTLILQWALLEMPQLFCCIAFFLTGNISFMALAFALLGFFFVARPLSLKIAILLQVRESELLQLDV
jgi:hypothetical protein